MCEVFFFFFFLANWLTWFYAAEDDGSVFPGNSLNPNHPNNLIISALDSSSKIKNTILSLKLFHHLACFPSAIYTIFQIAHTLFLFPSLFLSSAQNSFLSLTHSLTHWRYWYANKSRPLSSDERPLPCRKA